MSGWVIWGGALALYGLFRLWYDNWRGPLTRAEIDAFFAEIGRIDVKIFRLEHQLDALRRSAVIFDKQYAHCQIPNLAPPPVWATSRCINAAPGTGRSARPISHFNPTRDATRKWITKPNSIAQAPSAETSINQRKTLMLSSFWACILLAPWLKKLD